MKGIAPISIIILIVVILVAGTVGWYYTSHHPQANPITMTQTDTSHSPTQSGQPTTTAPAGETTNTMAGLVGQGQNLECDWHLSAQTSANSPVNAGKLWTSGGKGRSTVTATVGGMPMEANAIFQNGTAYSWVIIGTNKMGFKINPSDTRNSAMTPQQRQAAEQVRQNMLFNCHPWTPDETKFTLPTDVTFR